MARDYSNILFGYKSGDQFGPRVAPNGNASSDHKGVDLRAPEGTLISTPYDGKIIAMRADYSGSKSGNWIAIQHTMPDGTVFITQYMHMKNDPTLEWNKGDNVLAGNTIGQVGKTGIGVTGPHLHYEERLAIGKPDSDGNYSIDKAIPQNPAKDNFGLSGNGTCPFNFSIDGGWELDNLIQSISDILSPNTAAASTSTPNSNDNTYRIVYYDPLVLDLDGDGIETISGAQGSGVLFDQNADGIRTTSGWLKGDDGLLVRDINANGQIDTGAELFGDSTRLQSGATAANGFAALTDLDSNHDGQVNNQDSAFNELRVWRDVDQDGVTDTGELFTLDEIGVSSLNTEVSSTPNTVLDGGIQAETGSFTWTNGSTGTMADMNFTEDTFHSQYTTAIDIPVELQNLPNIAGMGRLRDLREAAALSPALANVLTLYSAAITRAEQKALLSEVLLEWAKTDPQYTESPVALCEGIDWRKAA